MTLRFRKRISVLPGIYLNVGMNGVSTTIGPRGANINIGKNGIYLNAGVPGTGLSYRHKLFNEANNNSDNKPIEPSSVALDNESNGAEDNIAVVTTEGLSGLKVHLEDAKNRRIILFAEIQEDEEKLAVLQSKLNKSKNGLILKWFSNKEAVADLEKQVDEAVKDIAELKIHYDESKADINIQFFPEVEDQYLRLSKSYEQLIRSEKIWYITSTREVTELKSSASSSVERKEVKFDIAELDFIKSEHPSFHLHKTNGSSLYVFPAFALLPDAQAEISLIDLKELRIEFRQQKFLESMSEKPSDTTVIDYTWDKMNKDGSRDMRLKDNYQIPVVFYGSLTLRYRNNLWGEFYVSDINKAHSFAFEFNRYVALLNGDEKSPAPREVQDTFTEQYFDLLEEFSKPLKVIVGKISTDEVLIDSLKSQINGHDPEEFIRLCIIYDLWNVVKILCNEQFRNDSTAVTGAVLLSGLVTKVEQDLFQMGYIKVVENIEKGILKNMASTLIDIANGNPFLKLSIDIKRDSKIASSTKLNSVLTLPAALKFFKSPLFEQYATTLYRFATIIAKSDGRVTDDEEKRLKIIYKLTHEPLPEELSKSLVISEIKANESLDDELKELDSLIGLDSVKKEVRSLINYIRIQKEREKAGLKSIQVSYHCVFTGSPGTGKTTVARIVAKIYMHLGILKKGNFVETDRSGLVAEYSGQTAVKVNKTVDSALDGVLFIDEAYSLVGENKDDFGKEAVATLIKRMEDNRERLIVILAGYTNEMKEFINTNPGFESRFNRYVEFADYQPNELEAIFKLQCAKLDYKLTEGAEAKLKNNLAAAFGKREKSFGNGRFVRNMFEKTIEAQANRLSSTNTLTKEILTTIVEEDIS